MKGKVCVVTGANSGIGYVAARELARLGAHVVLVCRNRERGQAARTKIREATGNDAVDLLIADFASQRSIRAVADEVRRSYTRLDVLVNNAGLIMGRRILTEDGIETTFAVNHIGYFLLTNELLDLLKTSAPSRIVNVTSQAHRRQPFDFDNLNADKSFNDFKIYGQSKMANILFTYELARRLEGTGVTVNCFHPGVVRTNFGNSASPLFRFVIRLIRPTFITPEEGAETAVYLASSPDVEGASGKYFIEKREARSDDFSSDRDAAVRLWKISEELTNAKRDE